jgi:hypothetical protein
VRVDLVLLRFGVSNYLSIRDYQELSFVASSLKDSGGDLISSPNLRESLLPVLLIYGANASGKSNILAAFRFYRSAILESQRKNLPSGRVPRRHFRLDEKYAKEPSRLDCDFTVAGIRYHYGFSATSQQFTEEWLFAYPQGSRQAWFQRNGKEFKFGKHLRGQNRLIEDITRPNSLFLSAAAQSNHEQLTAIYNYFESSFKAIVSRDSSIQMTFNESSGIDDRIVAFLRRADTGINSLRIKDLEVPKNSARFAEKFVKLVPEEFPDSEPPTPENLFLDKELSFGHATNSGRDVYFNSSRESRGTLRLLNLLQPIFKALDSGGFLSIDEIDSSLHTLLAKDIIGLFTSSNTNTKGAQLVATTHDTNLLCFPDIRRDQIWFTEKDKGGATHLYPLTDIRTRNTDNLEKGYLQGRFGAVPFLGSIPQLQDKGER